MLCLQQVVEWLDCRRQFLFNDLSDGAGGGLRFWRRIYLHFFGGYLRGNLSFSIFHDLKLAELDGQVPLHGHVAEGKCPPDEPGETFLPAFLHKGCRLGSLALFSGVGGGV